jgi:hypothetical protein
MDKLAMVMAASRQHLTEEWSSIRTRRVLEGLYRTHRRRRTIKVSLAAGIVAVGLVAAVALRTSGGSDADIVVAKGKPPPRAPLATPEPTPAPAPASTPAAQPGQSSVVETVLADGSRLVSETDSTLVEVAENRPSRVGLVLRRGRARVTASRRPGRDFVVKIEEVVVRVSGAVTVERIEKQVGVWVRDGEVKISWPGGDEVLGPGESRWIRTRTGGKPEARRSPPGADEILRQMDLARSGGRPKRAVALLQAFLRHHAADARAPLVAFTLGRLQLTELHRPHSAALSFERARTLAPAGILAEDAVAREVEAWAVAGEEARARTRAREYLDHYPSGRRIAAVRRYAGLD